MSKRRYVTRNVEVEVGQSELDGCVEVGLPDGTHETITCGLLDYLFEPMVEEPAPDPVVRLAAEVAELGKALLEHMHLEMERHLLLSGRVTRIEADHIPDAGTKMEVRDE